MLILVYIIHETSYEDIHENREQIYRVASEVRFGGRISQVAAGMPPLGPALEQEYPEVLSAVRFWLIPGPLIAYEDNRFREEGFYFVDPAVFDIFTFPLTQGDPAKALEAPFSIVITEEMAKKYFGDENPLGKTLTYEYDYQFQVTGVLKNIPRNTQFQCHFMASISSLEQIEGESFQHWGRFGEPYTYLMLPKGADPTELEQKLPEFLQKYLGERFAANLTLWLQPLPDIYLHSNLVMEMEPQGNLEYVYIFSAIAVLILVIAGINFMNLTTARSVHRARETGMRKVLGAFRRQLIRQFLGESLIITGISVLLAMVLFELLLPEFNRLLERQVGIESLDRWLILAGIAGITLLVGIAAGSYPAFYLSRFHPIEILKGKSASSPGASLFRKILVMIQFTISIVLIVGTVVIYHQLHFVKNTDLGFDREHTLVIPLAEPSIQYHTLKNELLRHPGIVHVAGAAAVPAGEFVEMTGVLPEGASEDESFIMQAAAVDYDYVKTLGLELLAGRDFSEDIRTDATDAYILNETAVKKLGWENPIGKKLEIPSPRPEFSRSGQVIGVVKDFHMRSLHEKIDPLYMYVDTRRFRILGVRIRPENVSETIVYMEETWKKLTQASQFEYSFIDERFGELYRREQRLGELFTAFSLLAVLVACLGLFGLAAFAAEQRTKEIGIRKVLGASMSGLVGLLSKDFMKLVLIANIIAWPVAWYAMNKWLEEFAYRINIAWWIFALAGTLALLIALLTVSYQAIRAAVANPVKSLRHE
jgi:putative ABC transport system permease protein